MNINLDTAKDTLCKNILIYGYCKYESKGCVFSHTRGAAAQGQPGQGKEPGQGQSQPGQGPSQQGQMTPQTTSSSPPKNKSIPIDKRKYNLNTPSFQPSVSNLTNKFSSLSPRVKEIPVFVPGTPTEEEDIPKKFSSSSTAFLPSSLYSATNGNSTPDANGSNISLSQPANPYLTSNSGIVNSPDYYQTSNYALQYHLYAPAPPPRMTIPLPPYETNVHDMFIPNNIRESLKKKNEATMQTLPRSNLPDHINVYHSLVPIDITYNTVSTVWGIGSAIYKVFNNVDGLPYTMRKLDIQDEIVNDLPFRNIKKWKKVTNSNVVLLQDCFTTMAFGKSSLIVVYDYYPNASTLLDLHKKGINLEPITENLLWTYLIQLVNAVSAIHAKGLHAGSSLNLRKIISSGKNRIKLSGVGIDDILNFEQQDEEEDRIERAHELHQQRQSQDIKKLGEVILELCSLTVPPHLRLVNVLGLLRSSSVKFSDAFLTAVQELISDSTPDLAVFSEVHLTSRMFKFINEVNDAHDYLETQLGNEIENARLFRLLSKLNFIIDRPDSKSSDWNENGNKYIIKLFRDYIFFQHDEFGKANVDLARVLVSLNKLDSGIEEKVLLVSRDDKSCIIVSYKELRDLVDSIFRALLR